MWVRCIILIILIIMILSSISICICIGLSSNKIQNENFRKEQENSLQFFNMNLPSIKEEFSELVFSCPDSDRNGGPLKIEILGSYFDVFDPWGQCSPEPIDIIVQTCKQDAEKNQGLCDNIVGSIEEENGVLAQWYRNIICGTKYKSGAGYGGEVNNKTDNNTESYGGSDYVCRLQDTTPFLAAKCNGKNECRINLGNSTEVSHVFGSVPCYNSTSGVPLKMEDAGYTRLPSDQTGVNDTSFQQGYVVKGIYRCVPE